jgi:AcrR family transcriptional regulator
MTGAERREAILDAASSLFADQSVEAVSMSDIVRRAGVSRPVVYDHFPTKQDLVVALIERHHAMMLDALAATAAGPITGEDGYRQVLETVFEHFASDPAGWRLLCDEPSGDPVVAEVQRRTRDEVLDLTVGLPGPTEPKLAVAEGLRYAINGLFGWGREHPEVTHGDLVDAAIALTWRGLGSPASKRK